MTIAEVDRCVLHGKLYEIVGAMNGNDNGGQ